MNESELKRSEVIYVVAVGALFEGQPLRGRCTSLFCTASYAFPGVEYRFLTSSCRPQRKYEGQKKNGTSDERKHTLTIGPCAVRSDLSCLETLGGKVLRDQGFRSNYLSCLPFDALRYRHTHFCDC